MMIMMLVMMIMYLILGKNDGGVVEPDIDVGDDYDDYSMV